jgi:hypothetical protein
MNSSKDQAQLSIEELMEIAKNPLEKDKNADLPMIKRFIVSDNLEQGTDWVPAAVIWDRYLSWATINKITAFTLVHFFKEFKNYFNKKKFKGGVLYQLSQKGFDLSPENLALINAAHVAERRTSNGKKKKNPRDKKKSEAI